MGQPRFTLFRSVMLSPGNLPPFTLCVSPILTDSGLSGGFKLPFFDSNKDRRQSSIGHPRDPLGQVDGRRNADAKEKIFLDNHYGV